MLPKWKVTQAFSVHNIEFFTNKWCKTGAIFKSYGVQTIKNGDN